MWTIELPRGRSLTLNGHPKVMGVLNITPDSFSDGGENISPPKAIERGLAMLEQGADMLDLGAESTRPGGGVYGDGAANVPAEQEKAVIGALLMSKGVCQNAALKSMVVSGTSPAGSMPSTSRFSVGEPGLCFGPSRGWRRGTAFDCVSTGRRW